MRRPIDVCLDGAAVYGVSDQDAAVIGAVDGSLPVTSVSGLTPLPVRSPVFGRDWFRRDMVLLDSLAPMDEGGGELCRVLPAGGATLRLEIYAWRANADGTIDSWSAALTGE